MVRTTNRQLTRLFFILVFVMAMFGACYADRTWHIDLAALAQDPIFESTDWIDFVSSLGEQVIQVFLGLTSKS